MKEPGQPEKVRGQNEQNLQIPPLHLHFHMLDFPMPSGLDLLVQAFHCHLVNKHSCLLAGIEGLYNQVKKHLM